MQILKVEKVIREDPPSETLKKKKEEVNSNPKFIKWGNMTFLLGVGLPK